MSPKAIFLFFWATGTSPKCLRPSLVLVRCRAHPGSPLQMGRPGGKGISRIESGERSMAVTGVLPDVDGPGTHDIIIAKLMPASA